MCKLFKFMNFIEIKLDFEYLFLPDKRDQKQNRLILTILLNFVISEIKIDNLLVLNWLITIRMLL